MRHPTPAMDFANPLCQPENTAENHGSQKEVRMKVNVEVDCSPEEARRFLGLPDVSKANEVYVDAVAKAMQGAGGLEQLDQLSKQLAPMGEMGLKLFQQFIEGGLGGGTKK